MTNAAFKLPDKLQLTLNAKPEPEFPSAEFWMIVAAFLLGALLRTLIG
jgi:hypothetical protein